MVISSQAPAGTSRLSASVPARVSRDRALAALRRQGRGSWLGEMVGPVREGEPERHLVDLELRVGDEAPHVTFRKAAYVDVGPARLTNPQTIEVPISWRAAGLAPLFPVFSGTLTWEDGRLSLDGYYAPPGGGLGILADRLLLSVAARGTARLLLEKIAAAMLGLA
jgi:hypothetical protein